MRTLSVKAQNLLPAAEKWRVEAIRNGAVA